MPLFYFDSNVSGEGTVLDEEGLDLSDLEAAKLEAMNGLYSVVKDLEPACASKLVSLAVRDSFHRTVFETTLEIRVTGH